MINPAKRRQYDSDRLVYLQAQFGDYGNFSDQEKDRDEHIQLYSKQLVDRVRDPIDVKKTAIQGRIARIKSDLEEYNEKSDRIRQEWATSSNEVLRMGGNALREIVVCAEEDVLMLEDEVGRLDGILEPKDQDGPKGRVTSGQYGSELGPGLKGNQPTRPTNQRVPSIPRSPIFPCEPLSASKLGIDTEESSGNDDSSSGGPSPVVPEFMLADRISNFLLSGPAAAVRSHPVGVQDKSHYVGAAVDGAMKRKDRAERKVQSQQSLYTKPVASVAAPARRLGLALGDIKENSDESELSFQSIARDESGPIKQHLNRAWGIDDASGQAREASEPLSQSLSTTLDAFPPVGSGMGLVEWQRLRDAGDTTAACSIFDIDIEGKGACREDSFCDRIGRVNVGNAIDSEDSDSTVPYIYKHAVRVDAHEAPLVEPMYRRPNREGAERIVHPAKAKTKAEKEAAKEASKKLAMEGLANLVEERVPNSASHTIGNLHSMRHGLGGFPQAAPVFGVTPGYGAESYGYHAPQPDFNYPGTGNLPGAGIGYASAVNPTSPIARATTTPGAGGMPTFEQSKGIKDWQIAVWAKAKEEKARAAEAAGGGGGQPKAQATTKTTQDGDAGAQSGRVSAPAATGEGSKQKDAFERSTMGRPAHMTMDDPFI